jgi:heparosan-N-sulfate-glucuronate 5-epimerase
MKWRRTSAAAAFLAWTTVVAAVGCSAAPQRTSKPASAAPKSPSLPPTPLWQISTPDPSDHSPLWEFPSPAPTDAPAVPTAKPTERPPKGATGTRNGSCIASSTTRCLDVGDTVVPCATTDSGEVWPSSTYRVSSSNAAYFQRMLERYRAEGQQFEPYLQVYDPRGDYLNFGAFGFLVDGPTIQVDKRGVVKVRYGRAFSFNPATNALQALTAHGRLLRDEKTARARFLAITDALIEWVDADGSLRHRFTFDTGHGVLHPGWASGMSQGLALSVFSRAYAISKDPKYLRAGEQALAFMLTPKTEGGTLGTMADLDPALGRWIEIEEYPTTPSAYTLNGSMYALLGLFDWAALQKDVAGNSAVAARQAFTCGVATLDRILPYYDLGVISAYDLQHLVTAGSIPVISTEDHARHVFLLHALYSVTGDPTLKRYEQLWAGYVTP